MWLRGCGHLAATFCHTLDNLQPAIFQQEARSWFLAAGYAVVAIDVRGTGASFGRWRAPWTPEEADDSSEVIDWIVAQPWSNQRVRQAGRWLM